jgi:hypothetical protein
MDNDRNDKMTALPNAVKKAREPKRKVYKATIYSDSAYYIWDVELPVVGFVFSPEYSRRESALRGLRRFAAAMGIDVEVTA